MFLKNRNKTEATDGQKNKKKENQIVINKIINFSRVYTIIIEVANSFKTYIVKKGVTVTPKGVSFHWFK